MLWTDAQGRSGKVQDTRTDKVRQIYVRDPDGYWVEANDKLKER
jgi:catechol 2,3-dioxygenase-like lactoylglutathione lyase family enzyme